jgi:prephenate dehydrogenase
VLEYDGWGQAESLLGTADLVLLCVPLKATLAVIRKVAPYLSPYLLRWQTSLVPKVLRCKR